jgi:hypothetical protein
LTPRLDSIWAAGSRSDGCGDSHAQAAATLPASGGAWQGSGVLRRSRARASVSSAGHHRTTPVTSAIDLGHQSGRTGRCRRCAADGMAAPTPASSRRRFNTRGREQTAPLSCSPPCEAPRRIRDSCEAAAARIDGGAARLGFEGAAALGYAGKAKGKRRGEAARFKR